MFHQETKTIKKRNFREMQKKIKVSFWNVRFFQHSSYPSNSCVFYVGLVSRKVGHDCSFKFLLHLLRAIFATAARKQYKYGKTILIEIHFFQKMFNILLLCLLSVRAILAEVPTGCATIKFVKTATYPTPEFKILNFRMLTGKDEKQEWLIEKRGEDFKMKHKQYGEYMYAHKESDGTERFVRTFNSGIVDLDRWKIEMKKGTFFVVRNVKFSECLSISGNNVVVSKKIESCDDDLWEILPC